MQILNFFQSALVLDFAKDIICPWLIAWAKDIYVLWERNICLNTLRKYVIIRLHNLKLDTDNAHIEPLQN